MDPIGTGAGVVLALSALYRTLARAPRLLTIGLWITSASQLISAAVTILDPPLQKLTGLANLSQIITYTMMIASSYIFARLTYRIAEMNILWPLVITWVSLVGICAVYLATGLSSTPSLVIETIPGLAGYIFSWLLAAGLLPTHIAAIIGARKGYSRSPAQAWLFTVYGGVGALYPVFMILDRTDLNTLRWPLETGYVVVWTIQLISFAALAAAGVIGAKNARKTLAEEIT